MARVLASVGPTFDPPPEQNNYFDPLEWKMGGGARVWELVESDTPRLESGTWVSYLGSGTVFRWNRDLAGSRFTKGKARWFQEMPGCSRKARVVSGKAVCCMKVWAVFQERFGGVRKVWGGSRKGYVGKAVWLQERLGGFRKAWMVFGWVLVSGKTGRLQERHEKCV